MTFIFGEPPEELKQLITNNRDQFVSYLHMVDSIWEKLSEDELDALAHWMMYCINQEHTDLHVTYMLGSLERVAQIRYGRCPWDMKNHDREAQAMMGSDSITESAPQMTPLPDSEEEARQKRLAEVLELQATYGIERNPKASEDPLAKPWRCANCHYGYESLQDRMMTPIGVQGCAGCRHKAKFG